MKTAHIAARKMILRNKDGDCFKINIDPLERMSSYKQDDKKKTEAGGVLLGRYIIDSGHVVADRITVPMVGDHRSRFRFVRSEKAHQRIITSAWKNSGGTCNYIGEWHTHPERYPTPSCQDFRNWKNILKSGRFEEDRLFFVIVGTHEIRVWEGNKNTEKIKRLRLNG